MFGQENEQLKECDLIEFCVGGLSESSKVQMTALAVPLICSLLKDQAIQFAQQSCSHLGRRGGLMVSALDSGASGPGSCPGWGQCVVFLGKTLYSHSASLHPGV